jgi:glucose-6-phosphate isomerase
MIQVDLSRATKYVNSDDLANAKALSQASFKSVQQKNGLGAEWLGWRDLLAAPNDALLEEMDQLAASIRKDADVFIVVGIGGSYLGAKAVIDMLKPSFGRKGTEILYAGHQISGSQLSALVDYISRPKEDGSIKSVYINVISKSGTTLEPALAFRVLTAWMDKNYGAEEASKRILATTSKSGGALNKTIEARGFKKFVLDDTVGGRFSVLTPVGLLPIAVAGIDIKSLFYAAVETYNSLEKDPTPVVDYAALRYALHKSGTVTDVISTFFPEMQAMGGWMQQLLGESEGKSGNGLFPAVLAYSTDLHSLGQLVQDGPRNLMETFLHIEKPVEKLKIPLLEEDVDGLNYLAGKDFNEVGQKAFEGTREAHTEGGIPIVTVTLPRLDEESAGSFLYFYELLTAVYVYNLGINPFDQPGVEAYKKAMFSLLGKP